MTSSTSGPTAATRAVRTGESRGGGRGAALLAAMVVLLVLASAFFAVATARTDGNFGPNEASYQVTMDHRLVVDLGPLGTVQMTSPAPRPLGVRIVVKEIPVDVTSVTSVSSITALANDADEYLQLFADRDAAIGDVVRGLAQDAAARMAWCLLGIGVLGGAGAMLLGRERGRFVVDRARPWAGPACLVVLVGLTVVAVVAVVRPVPQQGVVATALADTPLQGTRITGRLARVLDTFGTQIVHEYRKNEEFYAEANQNLVAAWDEADRQDLLAPLAVREDAADQAPSDAGPSQDVATGTAQQTGSTSVMVPDDDDVVTVLVVADIHCNTGMSPLVATAVDRSGAAVTLDAGDATIDGSSVEKICVTSLTQAAQHTTVVFAGGNHDGPDTAQQFADAGAVVLHGDTVDVDGIKILGDVDPYVSRTGQGTRLATDETQDEASARLTEAACDEHPDLLLIHNPRVGAPVLASGCVPYQISGHLHRRVGPEQEGPGVFYVNSSTAGAIQNQLTVGPLHGTAEMTVLRYDRTQHQILDYRIVQVHPDRSANVGDWVPYPVPLGDVAEQDAGQVPGADEDRGVESRSRGTGPRAG